MLRALVVTNMYPTPERPASGPFVRDQVEALRRRGDVEVELFAFPAGARNYPRAARALRRRYRGQRFDVVHVHFGLVAWPALLAGLRPLVVTLHGNDLLHPRSRPFTRAALPLMALPAAVSRAFSRERARAPGAAAASRSSPWASTSRASTRSRAPRRARHLGLDPAGPYLLFPHEPSRPLKRFDRAREAAGDVPLLTLGGVPAEEVPYWINAANAVIVPSQDEGMGLAVIEASACDVPAFGTPVGGAPGVARRDRGLGVPGMGRRALAGGAAPAPRGGGPAGRRARRPRSASRPTAWPRAWWRPGARLLEERAREPATYTRSDGAPGAFRTA